MQAIYKVMLLILGMGLSPQLLAEEPWDALKQGGVVIMFRHALTEPGLGDPPGYRLDDCRTQRNLSAQGREQARRLGAALQSRGVRPVAVYSSAWCRCLDTATLAFPGLPVKHLTALNSFFDDMPRGTDQANALRQELGRIAKTGVTVWVTHQVNVTALAGEIIGMGEAVVLRPGEAGSVRLIGRIKFNDAVN